MPSVSVVVPCLNEAKSIRNLLQALAGQDRPPDEIIIVDAGSTDGTQDVVAGFENGPGPRVRLLRFPTASIPAELNAGISQAQGEVIVRLDGHSAPDTAYISTALVTLEAPGAGVVGGTWSIEPGAPTPTGRAIARAVAHPLGAGDAAYRIAGPAGDSVDVDTVPFGCFRKTLWEQLGGFDERLLANQDYEFNYRVRRAGLRVILNPGIRSRYVARATFGRLARQYVRYGWWKGRMLRANPRSLRWRQAVPALFVLALAATGALTLAQPRAWPVFGLVAGSYGLAVGAATAQICARSRVWSQLPLVAAAFALVHVPWGTGVWGGLLAGRLR
jgi:succinoglycan biosynthesis protein ExoA